MVLLEADNLTVTFQTRAGTIHAVNGISFAAEKNKTLVIVGESGCGKSSAAKAIVRLLPGKKTKIHTGSKIVFEGRNLLDCSEAEMEKIRGKKIAMIFQDPFTYLNPTMTIGKQITETIFIHERVSKKEAEKRAIGILEMVRIQNPVKRFRQYPHEFSGGMRQRVMIAMALVCNPCLLIADEPTTALDVTIQAEILELLQGMQRKTKTAVIFITHDLGIAAEIADSIIVMYAGKIIERGIPCDIFKHARHPYTEALLAAVPSMQQSKKMPLYVPEGNHPDMLEPIAGCPFAPRCIHCMKVCTERMPPEMPFNGTHYAACWLHHPLAKKYNLSAKKNSCKQCLKKGSDLKCLF